MKKRNLLLGVLAIGVILGSLLVFQEIIYLQYLDWKLGKPIPADNRIIIVAQD